MAIPLSQDIFYFFVIQAFWGEYFSGSSFAAQFFVGNCQSGCLGKHMNQISVWIKVILPGRFNQTVNNGAALSTASVLANSQFFRPITKGLMLRSARLLLISRRPSSKKRFRYGHCSRR